MKRPALWVSVVCGLAFGAALLAAAAPPSVDAAFQKFWDARTPQNHGRRAPLTNASAPEPATPLYTDSRPGFARASETRDGSVNVFERGVGRAREIWKKALLTGAATGARRRVERFLFSMVSPDGSRIGYTTSDAGALSVTVSGTGTSSKCREVFRSRCARVAASTRSCPTTAAS